MALNPAEYYQHLDPIKLADDPVLVMAIEAASYCELYGKTRIRFSDLRNRTEDFLGIISNGNRPQFGGNFGKLVKRGCNRKLVSREKVSKKEVWIYPHILAVQNETNAMRIEDSDLRNKQVRILSRNGKWNAEPEPIIESIPSFLESVTFTVTRARELSK
jgi:hypothetical protein